MEPPAFPIDWALDRASLRTALATFQLDTRNLRRLFFDSPLTRNIPSILPKVKPLLDSTPSNTGYTIKATSAKETIFNQPIGPENRRSNTIIPSLDDGNSIEDN